MSSPPPAPVASIPPHGLLVFLLQLSVLLLLATALGRGIARWGMPAVVGELAAGVILGPSVLGELAPGFSDWFLPQQAAQFHLLDAVGQLGLVLLVGLTGTEMDMRLVRRNGLTAARVSLGGLIIPLGFGIAAGFLLPATLIGAGTERVVFALFLGVAMAVSAIPVIAKILLDLGLLHRDLGQLTLAAGMVDDVVGWLALSVVSAMAASGVEVGGVSRSICFVLATVALAAFPGRLVVRHALRLAKRSPEPAATVSMVTVLIVAAAAGTQAMGLESILGAFIAGILIGSSSELDRERTAPLWTFVVAVLAPIFFASAGLRISLASLAHPTVLLAGAAVLAIAIAGKLAGAYVGARASHLGRLEALALGVGMNVRGVIGIVIASVGVRLGVLNAASYTIIVLVAIVTSVMAPPALTKIMARIEPTAEERLRRRAGSSPSAAARDLAADPAAVDTTAEALVR